MEPTTVEDAVRQDDSTCMSICCSHENKPYQPQEEGTLSLFVRKIDGFFLHGISNILGLLCVPLKGRFSAFTVSLLIIISCFPFQREGKMLSLYQVLTIIRRPLINLIFMTPPTPIRRPSLSGTPLKILP